MGVKSSKIKAIAIVGPTATGKSDLAVLLAKKFNGEVISADSRQVYRGMDIGTGKITKSEMKGVRHHLLDVASPRGTFSVDRFRLLAKKALAEIEKRRKVPIICGGTGFYIDALTKGLTLPEVPRDLALRKELDEKTVEELADHLKKIDPRRASSIDIRNKPRLIRAIEIATTLGSVPPLLHDPDPSREFIFIGLDLPDKELRAKIRKRIAKRMKEGMLEEASRLHAEGLSWKKMDSFGLEYRYLGKLLRKEMTLEEFETVLEQKIWQYAKRQRTWFKTNREIHWFLPSDLKKVTQFVNNFLSK